VAPNGFSGAHVPLRITHSITGSESVVVISCPSNTAFIFTDTCVTCWFHQERCPLSSQNCSVAPEEVQSHKWTCRSTLLLFSQSVCR